MKGLLVFCLALAAVAAVPLEDLQELDDEDYSGRRAQSLSLKLVRDDDYLGDKLDHNLLQHHDDRHDHHQLDEDRYHQVHLHLRDDDDRRLPNYLEEQSYQLDENQPSSLRLYHEHKLPLHQLHQDDSLHHERSLLHESLHNDLQNRHYNELQREQSLLHHPLHHEQSYHNLHHDYRLPHQHQLDDYQRSHLNQLDDYQRSHLNHLDDYQRSHLNQLDDLQHRSELNLLHQEQNRHPLHHLHRGQALHHLLADSDEDDKLLHHGLNRHHLNQLHHGQSLHHLHHGQALHHLLADSDEDNLSRLQLNTLHQGQASHRGSLLNKHLNQYNDDDGLLRDDSFDNNHELHHGYKSRGDAGGVYLGYHNRVDDLEQELDDLKTPLDNFVKSWHHLNYLLQRHNEGLSSPVLPYSIGNVQQNNVQNVQNEEVHNHGLPQGHGHGLYPKQYEPVLPLVNRHHHNLSS